MARSFKEQTKISWKEGNYKKTLNDSELEIFKSLSRNQKDTVVLQYIKDKPISLLDANSIDLINEITDRDLNTDTVKETETTSEEFEHKQEVKNKIKQEKQEEKLRRDAERKQANEERIKNLENKREIQKQKVEDANREKLTKFFNNQGIPNPTNTTIDAFSRQRIDANVDKVLNSLGMFTTNREKQAQYNYYVTQQKQNFISIAQNDKLIKQNDEIIELLRQIANK